VLLPEGETEGDTAVKKRCGRGLVAGLLTIALVSVLGARQSLAQSPGADRPGEKRAGEAGKKQKIEECMAIWDAGTHMTKQEWRTTCERSLSQSPTILIPELPPDTAVR
jgi:hypothetical protein